MIAESLARRYAVALFNIAVDRNELDQVKDEYEAVNGLVGSMRNFRHFLFSPKVDIEVKKQVIAETLEARVSKTMLHFLFLLLDKKRQTLLNIIFGHFITLYDNYYDKAVITVYPAVPLGGKLLEEIKLEFEKLLKKSITLEEKVSPALIGGLQIRVSNTVYDASIRNKLQQIRKALV